MLCSFDLKKSKNDWRICVLVIFRAGENRKRPLAMRVEVLSTENRESQGAPSITHFSGAPAVSHPQRSGSKNEVESSHGTELQNTNFRSTVCVGAGCFQEPGDRTAWRCPADHERSPLAALHPLRTMTGRRYDFDGARNRGDGADESSSSNRASGSPVQFKKNPSTT